MSLSSGATTDSDTSYIPSPDKLNSDYVSSWFPSTPVKSSGSSRSGSVENSPVFVSEDSHVVYRTRDGNFFLKNNYLVPKNIFREETDVSVVKLSDMESEVSVDLPKYTDSEFRQVRLMLMKYVPRVPDVRAWFIDRIYKLHDSWKRLFWSPETAYAFPSKFKKLVQLFLLDKNFSNKNFEAVMLVFRHMSEKGVFFKTD